jgi:hypothetical protein
MDLRFRSPATAWSSSAKNPDGNEVVIGGNPFPHSDIIPLD